MLGALDRKLVDGVMVDHLWDAVEGLAELTQDEMTASATTSVITTNYLHMHETSWTPAGTPANKH